MFNKLIEFLDNILILMNIVNLSENFYIQFSQNKITMFLQVGKCPNFLKGHFKFPIKQTYFTLHSGLGNIKLRFQYKNLVSHRLVVRLGIVEILRIVWSSWSHNINVMREQDKSQQMLIFVWEILCHATLSFNASCSRAWPRSAGDGSEGRGGQVHATQQLSNLIYQI